MFDFRTGQLTYGQRKNSFPLPKSESQDWDSHLAYMYLYVQEGSGQKGGSGKTCASIGKTEYLAQAMDQWHHLLQEQGIKERVKRT